MPPIVNPRRESTIPADQLEDLRGIPPATIGHMLDFGFMANELRPIGRKNFRICGPAVTVRTAALDSAVVHHAIDIAEPGDVLVIDRNSDMKHACWGELTSLAAKLRGLAGTIVDGPATDVPEIEEMEYLVFCRGVSPITTRSAGTAGEINTTIQCGGVSVNPGDLILADDNGIMVIPPTNIQEIIRRCAPRYANEAEVRRRLLAGEKLGDISGASDRVRAALED